MLSFGPTGLKVKTKVWARCHGPYRRFLKPACPSSPQTCSSNSFGRTDVEILHRFQIELTSLPNVISIISHYFPCLLPCLSLLQPFLLQVQLRVEIVPHTLTSSPQLFRKNTARLTLAPLIVGMLLREVTCMSKAMGRMKDRLAPDGWEMLRRDRWKKNERISTKREGASRGFKLESSTSLQPVYNQFGLDKRHWCDVANEVIPAAKSFAKTNKKVLGLCQNRPTCTRS